MVDFSGPVELPDKALSEAEAGGFFVSPASASWNPSDVLHLNFCPSQLLCCYLLLIKVPCQKTITMKQRFTSRSCVPCKRPRKHGTPPAPPKSRHDSNPDAQSCSARSAKFASQPERPLCMSRDAVCHQRNISQGSANRGFQTVVRDCRLSRG